MTRAGYTLAHLGLLVAFGVITAILLSAGAPEWTQFAAVAGWVGCWHAISARRIGEVGPPWLHTAPYISLFAVPFAMLFLAEAQGQSAPLPQDAHPIPAWHEAADALALTALLIWPAATIALSTLPARRR